MKGAFAFAIGLMLLTGGPALGQSATPTPAHDACKGQQFQEDEVGLDYKGHCVLVEPSKGPVQGVFVRIVEDLDGVTTNCIVVIHTHEGWKISPDECETSVTDQFARVAVGDSWHMEVDETEK